MPSVTDAEFCVILATAPDLAQARLLAHALVERQLAACVNLIPALESIYRWEGKVETASEVLLLVKTLRSRSKEVLAALAELHPYQVPEGLVLPVEGGLEPYLRWIESSV